MQNCGQVSVTPWQPAVRSATRRGNLRGALPTPKEKHHASIIDPKRIGELLRAVDAYDGFFVTKSALWLAPRSCGPANYERHSGRGSTSRKPNGASLPSA
jgi:hypothetical protein